MKKILIGVLFGLVSLLAFGQTNDSASLTLTGIVGEFVSLSITPEPTASNLALGSAQVSPLTVATVIETSNTAYTVTVNSSNNFKFKNGGGDEHSYTLYYDGVAVTSNGETITNNGAPANNENKTVAITYSVFNGAPGTYADTLTFTINSN